MKTIDFTGLLKKLSPQQKSLLLTQLENSITLDIDYISTRSKLIKNPICSNCSSDAVVKYGSFNGQKRFKCKCCSKTFNELSGTSISWIKKKDQWGQFLKLMIESKTIRYIAERLELSTKTVFEWRHKVLISLNKTFTKKFTGIVEVDDIFLNFNQKGRKKRKVKKAKKLRGVSNQKVAVMVVIDRESSIDMKMTKLGRISKKSLNDTLNLTRFNKEKNIICSDEHRSLTSFFRGLNFEHQTINVNKGQHTKGIYHVQKLNNKVSQFKKWLKTNFNSVSTKYLQNYLNWFQLLHIIKNDNEIKGLNKLLTYSLTDDQTFLNSKMIEFNYQNFLKK